MLRCAWVATGGLIPCDCYFSAVMSLNSRYLLCRRIAAGEGYSYNSHMDKATVSKLKNNLSAYLRRVRAGNPVIIYDRDVPIARLERIESTARGCDRLALLADQGVTRPPRRVLSDAKIRALVREPALPSAGLLEQLLQDRAEGR